LNQTSDALVIIGLTIGIVILINVGIIIGFRRGSRFQDKPYRTFGQALNIVRNPWKKENEKIEELSTLLDSIEEEPKQPD